MAILCGDPSGFVHWLGVQCATWVSTSRGSTGRSLANPEGADNVVSVEVANFLACRRGFQITKGYMFQFHNLLTTLHLGCELRFLFVDAVNHLFWFLFWFYYKNTSPTNLSQGRFTLPFDSGVDRDLGDRAAPIIAIAAALPYAPAAGTHGGHVVQNKPSSLSVGLITISIH